VNNSGNVQCKFMGHSVRVDVDARESPSQLQEALKEGTKVITKRASKKRVDMNKLCIPGVDLTCNHASHTIQGTFSEHLGTFGARSWNIQCIFRER
jgi:hypothetical protein